MTEAFDWLKPSSIWEANGLDFQQPQVFFRPQILEFQSDTFMEDFFKAASAPKSDAFRDALLTSRADGAPLKLYQPVHGRFYLVTGSLCCRLPGFPDREVREAEGENVFFVLRKIVDDIEYAWIAASSTWRPVAPQPRVIAEAEERLPLASAPTAGERSIFFGYLPVASRETYAVPAAELAIDAEVTDPRIEALRGRFVNPLTPPDQPPGELSIIDATDDTVVLTLSVYLILDLWEFLYSYLQDVAEALRNDPAATFSGDQAQAKANLIDFLQTQALGGSVTLASALGEVAQHQEALNQSGGANLGALGFNANYNLKGHTLDLDVNKVTSEDGLIQYVQAALSTEIPEVELPKLDPQADTQYVLRCVYERPQCDPPIQVVSQATERFQLAPFFDPEAPARPVRIPLPADISIAGLRKFKKSVSFIMSDAIRKKVESLTGNEKDLITEDDPTLNEEPSNELAHICSFSIQIIFIVAFFLLIMFVVILNFVFWWIAFFKICLPLPKRLLPG